MSEYAVSIVSYHRREICCRTIEAVEATCQVERPLIVVADNASGDDTDTMLREMEAEGRLIANCLPGNVGTSGGHNANLTHCQGRDVVRLDDKSRPLAAGWLTSLKVLSEANHAIVGPPYDPTVRTLERIAPCVPFVGWDVDGPGVGGPLIYFPAEVMEALGAFDEIHNEQGELAVYGWDDVLAIQRAALLGWRFGFSLCCPVEFQASANPARREYAMRFHPAYQELLRQYREAERDLRVPLESTTGYQAGKRARE